MRFARVPISRGRAILFAGGFLACVFSSVLLLDAEARTPASLPANASSQTRPTASQPAATRPDSQKEEEIARVMEFLRVTQPDAYEKAKTLRSQDPARFEMLVGATAPTVAKLEDIRKSSPRLFDLSMQDLTLNYKSLRLAHELKRTDLPDSDRMKFRQQLSEVVSTEFAVQQEIRQIEIDNLRQQVENLGHQLQDRQQNKDKIIDKRVGDLIEKPPRLEW